MYKKALVCLAAALTVFWGVSAWASEPESEVYPCRLYVNGVFSLETVGMPTGDTGEFYLAFEDMMTALGFPMETNELTLINLSFVEQAFKARCTWVGNQWDVGADGAWDATAYTVHIYTPYQVALPWEGAYAASETILEYWEFEMGEDDLYMRTHSCNLPRPVFTYEGREAFQDMVNGLFKELTEDMRAFVLEEYAGQLEYEYKYSFSWDMDYEVRAFTGGVNVLTVVRDSYLYQGGAHGMPMRSAFAFDMDAEKRLTLGDVFQEDVDYEGLLLGLIYDIMDEGDEEDVEWEYYGVSRPDALPEGNAFCLEDGRLVIFYHPYDLAPYARGFVEFRIPLGDICGYLTEAYAKACQ